MGDFDQDEKREADTAAVLAGKFSLVQVVPEKRKPGRPKVNTQQVSGVTYAPPISQNEVWLRGLLQAIDNFDVKSPTQIKSAVSVADGVLEAYNARWTK